MPNTQTLFDKLIKALVLFMVLILLIPIFTVVSYLFQPLVNDGTSEVWQHLIDTVLFEYIQNSAMMAVFVSLLASLLGISTAWLTSVYRFPAHRLMPLLLMLPMAMPSYIIAFTYSGLLNGTGVVQTSIREWTGLAIGEYWFPDVHNVYGASIMLGLVLYPYVFLLARASFMTQSVHQLQVGEMLGLSQFQRFYRIALPMARPAIVAGLALVVMETLSEYGTVQFYGVPTFTTGIFRTWYGLDDVVSAVNLSAMLLFFVFVLFAVEGYSRRQIDYNQTEKSVKNINAEKSTPSSTKQWLMFAWCALPFVLGFAIPMFQLGSWAMENIGSVDMAFLQLAWHSFVLAIVTAVIAVAVTFAIYAYQRYFKSGLIKQSFRLVNLGYAIPGVVVALGVMIPAGMLGDVLNGDVLDGRVSHWLASIGIEDVGLLHGTFSLLIFAYLVRFMAVSLGSVESGYNKINPSVDDASRMLKVRFFRTLFQVHLPMMSKVLLPITLVLRPFNYNTLAVKTFELASDEFLIEASIPAIAIVLTGLIPVCLLNWGVGRE